MAEGFVAFWEGGILVFMKKTAPKMTLENMASEMVKGFERQDKNLENLAQMVARGFLSVEEKMVTKEEFNKFKKEVDSRFDDVDKKFKGVEENFHSIRRDILQVGDRFISRQEFEGLVTRFNNLEAKVKAKIK